MHNIWGKLKKCVNISIILYDRNISCYRSKVNNTGPAETIIVNFDINLNK